jgi:pimeloyl-ACP methyl ester carboxylesterase
LPIEVWTEEDGALVRVRIAGGDLEIAREDVASIATRQEKISRAGDEDVKVPANGFNLAATVSRPTPPTNRPAPPKWPAIVLVAGSGAVDRDEAVAGIPVFGQLAGALADGGFLVIRYDKRGVGQSGGRAESATLGDYAEDLLAVVRYLSRRKDVDKDRISVVGHSEGAWVGLLAASREKDIRRLVLSAAPATPGHELVLEQQKHQLELMKAPENEAEAKIALQKRIMSAVMTGTSWEGVPPSLRKQADTPWFASFLKFDPVVVMRDVRQPLLVVQGTLDRQVPPYHAARLVDLASQRKKGRGVEAVSIDGVNHLFVTAATGEVSEYPTLPEKQITPKWPAAIVDWLMKVPPEL